MANRAIPVILIGQSPDMGRIVADHLKPEVEVLHFMSTPEAAKQDLPRLLQHKEPSQPSDSGIGSQTYSRPVESVVLGSAYTNDVVDEIRQSCADIKPGVPWLTGGFCKAEFEERMRSDPPASPEKQGPWTAEKVNRALKLLLEEGKGGRDGVYSRYKDKGSEHL